MVFGKVYSAPVRLNPCFNGRYSQRLYNQPKVAHDTVLILVLMEDTLRVKDWLAANPTATNSLNPCFNGRYSQSNKVRCTLSLSVCLNPCFNGRYSQRLVNLWETSVSFCLNPCFNGRYSQRAKFKELIKANKES